MISPYTRGGKVFTERGDHSSMILFLGRRIQIQHVEALANLVPVEQYLSAKGYHNVTTEQLSDWRRDHMSNLLNAFDFENVSVCKRPWRPRGSWLTAAI